MIKDKISCDLKNRIIEDNLKTRHDGLERGFYICIGRKDKKLYPHERKCVGEYCKVELIGTCPNKAQGTYHVHPLVQRIINETKETTGKKVSEEEAAELLSRSKAKYVSEYTTRSGPDLIHAIMNRQEEKSHGTTCIGSDFKHNIVDCWSIKKNAYLKKEIRSLKDLGQSLRWRE